MYHFDCHKLYAHHEYLLLFRMETKESSKKLAILTLELKKHPSISEKYLSIESHSRSYSPNHTVVAGLIDRNRPKTMNSASK